MNFIEIGDTIIAVEELQAVRLEKTCITFLFRNCTEPLVVEYEDSEECFTEHDYLLERLEAYKTPKGEISNSNPD